MKSTKTGRARAKAAPAAPPQSSRPIFLHGPDRRPFDPAPLTGGPGGERPFHGIISLGLMHALEGWPEAPDWARLAPWLDAALLGDAASATRLPAGLLELARDCQVLSFYHSTLIALEFARRHLPVMLTPGARLELWNIKEGHTTSVWQVAGQLPGSPATCLALNVARDAEAGHELLRSVRSLRALARTVPQTRVARPLHEERISSGGWPGRVVVAAQEWIEDALELGFVREAGTGRQELFAIERFLTAPDDPGRILSVAGRRLADPEREGVLVEILSTMLGAAEPGSDSLSLPRFEINHGDWVLQDGHAVLVAASGERAAPETGEPLDAFLVRLFSATAGEEAREWLLAAARRAVRSHSQP